MSTQKDLAEPLVSVCIPTYNRSGKLKRAVEKLISCSYDNLEIIISDNASCDNTKDVCTAIGKLDNRVKYFRHLENNGPTKNFEFSKSQATGKYFLWLSDDDYLDRDYIRICVDELERRPDLVLVSGLGLYHGSVNQVSYYGNIVQPNSSIPLLRVMKYLWTAGESSILYGVYRANKIQDCRMPNCLAGDFIWVADVLLKGRAKVIPITYVNREFGDSMSSTFERYASIIKAPAWHGKFPLIAISINIANYISFESNEYRGKSKSRQVMIYFIIISLHLMKYSILKLRIFFSKIPLAKKIYRRFLKRQVVV
jgi:glycosyltransferase involved in cell wall biosynthesis